MNKPKIKIKYIQPVLLLCVGIIFLLLERFSFTDPIKVPFSYVFEPIMFSASSVKTSMSNWGSALFSASSYIDEYTKCKQEVIDLKSKETDTLNYAEYNALKKSNSVILPNEKYVASNVLGVSENGDLYINSGTRDSIKDGDIVYVGNVFVGVISRSQYSSSLVILPTNRVSTYEVVILPSNAENIDSMDGYIKSRAVISGSPDGIKIENIGSNTDVSDGDLVVIRDERIGKLLVVGRVVSLSKNPAATSKSGFVSPVFDYTNLLTVLVKIE